MSLIINDFEVIIEEPEDQEESQEQRQEELGRRPLFSLVPQDIYDVLRRHTERKRRVRAH